MMFTNSLQPNLLLSPTTSGVLKPNRDGLHPSTSIQPVQYNSISSSSASNSLIAQQQPAMPSDIDDKSLKDCTEIIHRQINKLKSLNELSDVLQIENIS